MIKNILKAQLVALLVISAGFSILVAQAEESVESVENTLPICDHNADGVRNLSDVALFAQCTDTFDVNGDGIHDLTDISLYASNNQNDQWCATEFVCEPISVSEETVVYSGGSSSISLAEISNVAGEASCAEVTITWSTSLDSISWLVYGVDEDNLNLEYKSEDKAKEHSVVLKDLEEGQTYYYTVKATSSDGITKKTGYEFTVLSGCSSNIIPEVLGEKIEEEDVSEVCNYLEPDEDVLGQTEWADGTLLRGCGPEVYRIENQTKRHIKSLEELFNYIGQRIYNVTDNILNLF